MDDRGRPLDKVAQDFGDNVLIVDPTNEADRINRPAKATRSADD